MKPGDWEDPGRHAIAIVFDAPAPQRRWLVLVNAQESPLRFSLPPGHWQLRLAADAHPHGAGGVGLPLAPLQEIPPTSLWVASS